MKSPGGRGQRARRARKEAPEGGKRPQDTQIPLGRDKRRAGHGKGFRYENCGRGQDRSEGGILMPVPLRVRLSLPTGNVSYVLFRPHSGPDRYKTGRTEMAKKISGLGRGIDAIFLENTLENSGGGGVTTLRVAQLEPKGNQPRKYTMRMKSST